MTLPYSLLHILMQAVKGSQWVNQQALGVTYIPHKCIPNMLKGKIFSAAADQHALPTPAEHNIHPPLIIQETKSP